MNRKQMTSVAAGLAIGIGVGVALSNIALGVGLGIDLVQRSVASIQKHLIE